MNAKNFASKYFKHATSLILGTYVLCTLSPYKNIFRGYLDVTNAIVKTLLSLTENSCRRCIFMHSWHSEPSSRAEAPLLLRWTLLKYIGPILDNMREAEKILESTSDINYSVILPAGLKNGNQSGMYGK